MEAPISASLGAMGSLLRKLDLLLEASEGDDGCTLRLHKGAKYGTHVLKEDLEEITSYLEDLSEVEDPPLTARCWMKQVRELSYDIEDYFDSFVLPGHGHAANIKTRSGRRRIKHIKITRLLETNKKLNRRKRIAVMISDFRIYAQEAIERHQRYELDCRAFRRIFSPAGRLPMTYEEGADIIVDGRMRKFMDSLATNDMDRPLKVVSVVGSEGIGKTTFVKMLYNKLKGQFDCRAFVRLTRKPDIKTILRDILTQVQRQQSQDHCQDSDLIGKIREHLQHKRYLIVIDDLWSATVWDVINLAFPGGRMYSRIIITTQIEDVALASCCYHSEYVFTMRPLDDDLSRKLFFDSLFCSESDFPQKLKQVSNNIVKICGGLPLATVVIASLLARHPVILMEQWTYVCDSLSSNLRTSSTTEGMKIVVNFSYNNLTHHLKTCLLYLSMYSEGFTIFKDDLMKQWVAEGFIDATQGREVEIAESYFHELINRRFLQPTCIKYNNEVISCSVHDVVRDLIVRKSLEENFVTVLDCYRRNVALSEKVHRLSLHFPHAKYTMTNIRSSQVRSLTYFGLSECMPFLWEFKLLRVLNLVLSSHDDDIDTIDLTRISELSHLRYLKVASDICIQLPKHMGGLQYLETLDIGRKVIDVPWDIFYLPCLLHLHLPFETNLMDWIAAIPASMWSLGKLTNLQYFCLTCSTPVPDHLQRNMEALGSLLGGHRNLKDLVLILGSAHKKSVVHGPSEVTISWNDFAPRLLERFEWLPHICTFPRVPKWIGELGNLCILKISVTELTRDGVNVLEELPSLTAFSLYVQIAPTKRIIFGKAGFSVLKYFKFMCSTVPWLKFEADAMPSLQKLKIGFSAHGVDQHGITPISIEHLPGLKEIIAKVGIASSDAEYALTVDVSNHPGNPRIRVQLVDWNFYGDGVWHAVSKQRKTQTLVEDEILEEGLDEECVHQYQDLRDARHDGGKRRRKDRTQNVKSLDVSTPSILRGSIPNNWDIEGSTVSSSYSSSNVTHAFRYLKITNKDKASASSSTGISSNVFPVDRTSEATNSQQGSSNTKRCQFPGCVKGARGASGRCVAHGGGRRCQKPGCQKGAEGRTIYCKSHGGGKRCQYLGCTKSAEGRTDHCIAHGGGRRCNHEGCTRAARGKPGLCIKHGGGKRCQKENCTKSAEGHSGLCIAHGGGRRCQFPDCTKGAQGMTKFCKVHGGGKRCAFGGGGVCPKVMHGGTQYCVAHGGGKRCARYGCTKSARGRTDYCVGHGGGKICKFEGCAKSAQGSTDFCKLHGGGKHCSWDQADRNFGAGAGVQRCDRLARGKTGLCVAHSGLVQAHSVHDGDSDALGPARHQFAADVKPTEMEVASVKTDPHEKTISGDESLLGTCSSVIVDPLILDQFMVDPLPGRVHGGGLLALLGGSSTSAGGSGNCASGKIS